MRQEQRPDSPPPDRFGEIITDSSVRGYYREIIDHLRKLHEGVTVSYCDVDVRAEYGGRLICRIVPYRELLHIQIGHSPVWEVRVKNETGFMEAMGHILETFLKLAAKEGGEPGRRLSPYREAKPL